MPEARIRAFMRVSPAADNGAAATAADEFAIRLSHPATGRNVIGNPMAEGLLKILDLRLGDPAAEGERRLVEVTPRYRRA